MIWLPVILVQSEHMMGGAHEEKKPHILKRRRAHSPPFSSTKNSDHGRWEGTHRSFGVQASFTDGGAELRRLGSSGGSCTTGRLSLRGRSQPEALASSSLGVGRERSKREKDREPRHRKPPGRKIKPPPPPHPHPPWPHKYERGRGGRIEPTHARAHTAPARGIFPRRIKKTTKKPL